MAYMISKPGGRTPLTLCLASLSVLGALICLAGEAASQSNPPSSTRVPTLFLIGDSTVRNGKGDGANGQWGWGDYLGASFDSNKLNVVNRAVGGLSSRTFLTQGYWD